jgi:formamidopyrimidine-DNA glycosylase
MPELPEVEALSSFLCSVAGGRVVSKVDVASFSVLKTFDPPVSELVGRPLTSCGRRGKHLLLGFGDAGPELWLVLHLARGGWVRWVESLKPGPVKPGKGPLALRVRFDDGTGFDVTEAGTEKRVAAWVVRAPDDVEHVATLGIDVLSPSFTADALAEVLSGAGRAQVKGVLTDQRLLAGVGNAYSDEALHVARLSPFKPAASLTRDEVVALHAALVGVLRDAVERSSGLAASGLKKEKKSGLRVHGREGEACPECGDTVRSVFFASKSLQYCPTCQTGGKPLADRRLSRLLK